MSETGKKVVLIAVIVLAVIAAGFGATRLIGGDQPQVVNEVKMPGDFKSEKQQALEAQGAPAGGGERDLSGAPPGG